MPRQSKPPSPADTGPTPGETANTAGLLSSDPDLREGARPVPEYVLVHKLGAGGFGQVWKARDENGFEVALKFLCLEGRAGATELRAVEVMRNIRHAHVLPMFRAWQAGNWLVLALELGDRTLYQRLAEAEHADQPGIPRRELLGYLVEAAKGLDYLHTLSIQHRDVKPQNLLLVGGSVKVADFGLAKLLEHSQTSNSGSLTVAYAAPEQFRGLVSPHSDQYSLAVSYCQLRAGRLPFKGGQQQVMFGHIQGQPDLSMLPEGEQPAVARALAKQPEERWPSCREFVKALAAGIAAPKPPDPVPTQQVPPPYWPLVREEVPVAQLLPEAAPVPDEVPVAQLLPEAAPAPIGTRSTKWSGREPNLARMVLLTSLALLGVVVAILVIGIISRVHQDPAASTLPAEFKNKNEEEMDRLRREHMAAFNQSHPPAPPALEFDPDSVISPLPGRNRAAGVRQRPQPLDCTAAAGVGAPEVRMAQEAWARYLGRQVEETVEIAGRVKMTFVLVPPGRFRMGSPKEEEDRGDEDLHTVVLTEPFDLNKTEVTQAQYKALTGKEPSKFKGSGDLPVEQVNWDEARDYAAELTNKLSDRHVYRLPTEAEWEYACRGGRPSSQPFGIGDGRSLSSRHANINGKVPYAGAAKCDSLEMTCKVGSYPANALGLFDMHGNVREWCADPYGPYPTGEVTNPTGPADGPHRLVRGGGWFVNGRHCRAAYREMGQRGRQFYDLGFRLARSVPSGGK
jgi:formylglycine-generating enzyme required for sulfatase activity/serine/threonine protein kinase